ncbi:lipoyl(octanoyl) transferase LipB [Amnibacterium setariae]|uniref:lipoyl(octanoyl) transferase LipB n=1 Tax=Amnibacterium setariae TaxID=2306585 RepID=UPI0018F72644|nr:lipoyl(octanoyl) transferase LipB [Amnibacterium setariae]
MRTSVILPEASATRRRVATVIDVAFTRLAPDLLDYHEGWALQRSVHAEVVAGTRPDSLILCEHEAVYTAGKRTAPDERPVDSTPVVDVDRGGKITWHGPGQLTGYPILRLPDRHEVVAFVRDLEAMMIDVAARFGVTGERVEGRSGVWVRNGGGWDKIGAIGLRVEQGVTMHGFALNCSNELTAYDRIVACGIRDAGVTTLSALTGRTITPADAAPIVLQHFRDGVLGLAHRTDSTKVAA